MGSNPIILALSGKAGSGKGEVATFLKSAYGGCNLLVTSFAKALRKEIHDEVQQIAATNYCPPREALEILCVRMGVPFDPFAKPDALNPYGKQRKLQQIWGTEYRRAQCATYWVDRVDDEIASMKPDIVILDDMRFLNEGEWVQEKDGYTAIIERPDNKLLQGAEAAHVSENQLADYPFHYLIKNDGSLKQLHYRANATFHSILQRKLF